MPRKKRQEPATEVAICLPVPSGDEISGLWRPNATERRAAWELHVELSTRVSAIGLDPHLGVLREALTSYYTLFGTTRDILRHHGPEAAPRRDPDQITFGSLAVTTLNAVVRPMLTRWHPALAEHEAARPAGVAAGQHERTWAHEEELREELHRTRKALAALAQVLAEAAETTDLLVPQLSELRNQRGGGGIESNDSSAGPQR